MRRPATITEAAGALNPPAHARAGEERFQEAVDPGYWPRAMGLRVVIAICYVALVPAGLLPMSNAWWALSGGTLLVYSVVLLAWFLRSGVNWFHVQASPYTDTLIVSLAIVALAEPELPIWMGYFLIIPGLANYHSTRYVLGFSLWSIVNCWAAFACVTLFRGDGFQWQFATIITFMAVFTALNADIISASNRKLRGLVREASLTDPLTGLDNRRRFRQILDAHGVHETQPLAVLMYDLDNFKQINETLGHVHADTILVSVAAELRASFRGADTVARYGGDEMIVLAHVAGAEEAIEIAERSIARVEKVSGVTLSVGVAVYPLTSATLEAAVREADDALLSAKRHGKARVMMLNRDAA